LVNREKKKKGGGGIQGKNWVEPYKTKTKKIHAMGGGGLNEKTRGKKASQQKKKMGGKEPKKGKKKKGDVAKTPPTGWQGGIKTRHKPRGFVGGGGG